MLPYTAELSKGELGLNIKELGVEQGHKMLRIMHNTLDWRTMYVLYQ